MLELDFPKKKCRIQKTINQIVSEQLFRFCHRKRSRAERREAGEARLSGGMSA